MSDPVTGGNDGRDAPRGASVIALRGDAVLMVERTRPPFEGMWSFPGGRLETGETAAEAARRELREETGMAVGELRHLGEFVPAPDRSPMLIDVFCAWAEGGEPRPGDDARRSEFVPLREVLERPLTPGAPGWIARALAELDGLDAFFCRG